jgi:hypothetical protein
MPVTQGSKRVVAPVPTSTRVRGVIAMLIGVSIAIGMAVALISETRGFFNPGVSINGSTYTGTTEQGYMAIGLLALLEFIGVMFAIGGIQLFRTGRFSKWVGGVLAAIVALIVFVAARGNQLFDRLS